MWVGAEEEEEAEKAEEEQTQALERGRAPGNKKDKKGTKGHKRAQKGTGHRGEGRRCQTKQKTKTGQSITDTEEDKSRKHRMNFSGS